MVLKRSVFLEVRKTQGREGQKAENILDIFEKEAVLAKDRAKYGSGPSAESEKVVKGPDNLYECLRQLKEEFPMEALVYNESAEVMQIEDQRREKAYTLFSSMGDILLSMASDGSKFKSKDVTCTAETIRICYKFMPEGCDVPKWIKNSMAFINTDANFVKYARDYWAEMDEEEDQFDFGEHTVEVDSEAVQMRRRKSVMLIGFAEMAKEDDKKDEFGLKDVGTVVRGDEKRASLSKEQKEKNSARRASMMTMVDKSKMAMTDHRQSQSGASGRKKSKFQGMAQNVVGAFKQRS